MFWYMNGLQQQATKIYKMYRLMKLFDDLSLKSIFVASIPKTCILVSK